MAKIPTIKWCDHEFKQESKVCIKCQRRKPRTGFNSISFGKVVTGKRIK